MIICIASAKTSRRIAAATPTIFRDTAPVRPVLWPPRATTASAWPVLRTMLRFYRLKYFLYMAAPMTPTLPRLSIMPGRKAPTYSAIAGAVHRLIRASTTPSTAPKRRAATAKAALLCFPAGTGDMVQSAIRAI